MMTSHWSNTVLQSTTKAPSNYFWINIFINTTTASQAQLFNIIFTHDDTLFNTCLNPATVHQSNISPSAHFKRRDNIFFNWSQSNFGFHLFRSRSQQYKFSQCYSTRWWQHAPAQHDDNTATSLSNDLPLNERQPRQIHYNIPSCNCIFSITRSSRQQQPVYHLHYRIDLKSRRGVLWHHNHKQNYQIIIHIITNLISTASDDRKLLVV